ncbi:hypothetical protein [Aquimarina sp. 2304DJ70-9]|uniref:hypothetical protein n=1 Tax=Aquimarina penaris TaxID=3231044 RepID=UPI003461A7D8
MKQKIGLTLCSGFLLMLFACNTKDQATQIILDSLEAHGGIEKWKNTKELSYLKTTILFDSLGNIEKKITQKHKNTFRPNFTAEMYWEEDSIHKKVTFEGDRTTVFYNDSLQNSTNLEEKYYNNIIAANYVMWQPYKLLDADVSLRYMGEENIDGKQAHVIKASYVNDDGSAANTWWYYFDVTTNKLVGNMVHHGTTYSYIENIKYENKTGLFLNAERKSYMTDSVRNIKFLRAQYFYEIVSFQ